MMATGVARPRAQGQLMTSTAMARVRECSTPEPTTIQAKKTARAMTMTIGTKMPAIWSATFATGALVAAASDTILMIWDRGVSFPTLVARHCR